MIPKPLDKISSLKKYRICSVILKRNKLLCLFEKSGLQFPHSATHYLYSQVILVNKKRNWVQCWSDCVIINKIFAVLINLMSISFTETNRKLEMRCWRQKAFACIANVWDSELIKLVKFTPKSVRRLPRTWFALHCLPHDRLTLRLLKMNDMETGLKLSGSISQWL